MEHWTDSLVGALVEDTCKMGKSRGDCAGAISERNKEELASIDYDRTVKAGHLRAAVRQATNWGRGGVLHVNSMDSKSGMIVLDTLRMKHPDLQEVDLDHPDCLLFKSYSVRLRVLPLEITPSDV